MKQQRPTNSGSPASQEQDTTAQGVDTSATDDLLDEIDDLLETNAEEFVKSFVQKGGQ